MTETKQAWKAKLLPHIPLFILIYCVIQPLLDVAGYWQLMLGISNTVTMILRMLLLIGSVLLGFLLSDRKRCYFLTAGILLALTALHVASNLPGGYTEPVTDLSNLVRIYLMPLTVLCFCTFLSKGGDEAFQAVKKGILINIILIVLIEIVSVLTGTDRETYRHEHIGVLGWFYWANSQSAILSIAAPIVICWAVQRWPGKPLAAALFTVAAEVTLYFFGTRLTFAAMVASGVGVSVCLMLVDHHRWKQALAIFLVTVAFTCAYPLSPAARRMNAVVQMNEKNEQGIEKQHIVILPDDAEIPTETDEIGETGEEDVTPTDPEAPKMVAKDWVKMRKIYHGYLSGMVQRFGYDRVMEKYDYTLDAAILGDWRIEKLSFCELLMEDGSVMQHLFGLNLLDMREYVKNGVKNEETGKWEDGYQIFDVENDFHGIYFLLGLVGLALMLVFLLYFGVRALLRVIRDFRTYFTVDMIAFVGAYVFSLLHAYFTVSVLRRNNASVYLGLVLACLWYLTRKEVAKDAEK